MATKTGRRMRQSRTALNSPARPEPIADVISRVRANLDDPLCHYYRSDDIRRVLENIAWLTAKLTEVEGQLLRQQKKILDLSSLIP